MLRHPVIVVVLSAALFAVSIGFAPAAGAGEVVDGRFPTEETFVDQTYRDLLGREPDASGLVFWADGVDVHQGSYGSLYVSTSTSNDRIIRITPELPD